MHIITATPLQIFSFLLYPSIFFASFLLASVYFWQKKKLLFAIAMPIIGFIAARYYFPVTVWLRGLGADSFEEAQSFDPIEAFYFAKTLLTSLNPSDWRLVLMAASVVLICVALFLCAVYLLLCLCRISRYFNMFVVLLSIVFFSVPIFYHYSQIGHTFVSNSETYQNIQSNYSANESLFNYQQYHHQPVHVVIYIGESTTRLHWGIFGYPVNTTPLLEQFKLKHEGLLSFSSVSSTHTHTSRSLLEALSLGLDDNIIIQQVVDMKRAALPAALNHLGISSALASNQRQSGAANYAGTIIFSAIKEKQFSERYAHLLGSAIGDVAMFDHDYFFSEPPVFQLERQSSYVTFLHSYAGHFSYQKNIPPNYHYPIDTFFSDATPLLAYGKKINFSSLFATQYYDNAMRYIDGNLAYLFNQANLAKTPTVVIYFSDHGESVHTGKDHDSSSYQIEMSHIPFLMYFNDAAQQAIPEVYQEFRQASIDDRPSTLAQLSPTVLRILGYEVSKTGQDLKGIGLDAEEKLPPIVVRKIGQGLSYIRSSHQQLDAPEGSIDSTDNATNIWLSRQKRFGHDASPMLCYSESNTFAKAIRAGLTADCLTISLELDEQQQLVVLPNNSQSAEANRWLLDTIEKTAQSYQAKLWLNASAIDAEQACALIEQRLISMQNVVVQLNVDSTMSKSCQQLAENGVEFAMNVPSNIHQDNGAVWYDELMQRGWRPILLGSQQQFLALSGLLGANWGLLGVEAKQLPWQTQDGLSVPKALLINTAWDINTR